MNWYQNGKEIYKGFEIEEIRKKGDGAIFSKTKEYKATRKKTKTVIVDKGIRNLKKQIREYWEVSK